MIDDFERIRELAAEVSPSRRRKSLEPPAQFDTLIEFQPGLVCVRIHFQISVAKHVVQQMAQVLAAQHRRIHFDNDVESVLVDEVFADALNLVRRASVECRNRDTARQACRIVQLSCPPMLGWNRLPQLRDQFRCILHPLQKRADLATLDTLQVVAHADIKDDFARRARQRPPLQPRPVAEHVNQHRSGNIFPQRLLDPQFLRPFDIKTDVLHVDARPWNLQPVAYLHRLEFEDARSGGIARE